jgi:tetratricopeptide (TPR) repeat protein
LVELARSLKEEQTMSIASFSFCSQRKPLRFTLSVLAISALAWLMSASCGLCGQPPAEPEEIIIVSDEQPVGESETAPAEEAEVSETSADESQKKDETETDKEEASPKEDEDESEQDPAEAKKKPVVDAEVDEVAPIRNRITAAHPRITQTDKEAEEAALAEESEEEEPGLIQPVQRPKRSDKHAADSEDDSEVAPEELPEEAADAPARPLVEGASFKGVLPDVTTVEEMEEAWGPAKEIRKTPAGTQHIHYLKPFKQVVATVTNGKVDTVIIHLDRLFEPGALAKQLKLDDVEPATIYNGQGQMLGRAFPERGVLFGFASGSPVRVAQIVVEPINSQPFVTRAENKYNQSPAEALVDVEYAIDVDPEYDRAYAVRARILWELGQFDAALMSSEKSLALVPHEADPRLTRAKVLLHKQEFDRAEAELQKLCDDDQAAPIIRANACLLLGNTLAAGPARAFNKAIKHHTEAIKLGEEVAANSAGPIRRWAKELLVDAHLAVANDVAWGHWQQKQKVVPKSGDRSGSTARLHANLACLRGHARRAGCFEDY